MKKLVCILIIIFAFFILLSGCTELKNIEGKIEMMVEVLPDEAERKVENIKNRSYAVGDMIKFGQYIMGYDNNGNYRYNDIEWRVLEVNEEDNKVLLLCNEIIDGRPYNDEKVDVTWENCDLRSWLNQDFYDEAFNDSEKAIISDTEIPVNDSYVIDKVFLPTYAQTGRQEGKATRYAYERGVTCYTSVQARGRSYSFKDGDDYSSSKRKCMWWIRTESGTGYAKISPWAKLLSVTSDDISEILGIRPAIWIDLTRHQD
ncbi:MAG: hypothetical protein HFF77_04290 [Oscillospiraceae bacterium]|nr:hypothetical protein [Oscillospiraceae bacterium]